MKISSIISLGVALLLLGACFDSKPAPIDSSATSEDKAAEIDTANMTEDQIFLVKSAQLPGVQKTNSGLLYKVIKKGYGATPTAMDTVEVNYEGKLIDGSVFDSSYVRGKPASFGVSHVIAGWTEGLQLMQEGAVYDFIIPAELGYGSRGTGGSIPPNATLRFRVELLGIK